MILDGSLFCFLAKKTFITLETDLFFLKEFLSNWFQKSTDLKLSDILDVYEFIDKEPDLIEAYVADDDILELRDPDEEFDDKVSEE